MSEYLKRKLRDIDNQLASMEEFKHLVKRDFTDEEIHLVALYSNMSKFIEVADPKNAKHMGLAFELNLLFRDYYEYPNDRIIIIPFNGLYDNRKLRATGSHIEFGEEYNDFVKFGLYDIVFNKMVVRPVVARKDGIFKKVIKRLFGSVKFKVTR